jgi:[ribosomal protein S18]-alanine N-acetyltransferase
MTAGASSGGRQFRRFTPSDIPAIVEILEKSQGAAQWSAAVFDSLETSANPCWVVEENAWVVGFLAVRVVCGEAELLNIAVEESRRRAGRATALLQRALLELSGGAIREVYLEVRESNTAAIAFYEKQGFERFASRPGYYRDPDDAAICMKKILTGLGPCSS